MYWRQSSKPVLASTATTNERPPQSPPDTPAMTIPL